MMLGFCEFPCRGLKKEAKYKKKREIVLNLECWTKKTRYTFEGGIGYRSGRVGNCYVGTYMYMYKLYMYPRYSRVWFTIYAAA